MARLNLTLDGATFEHLKRHAQAQSRPVARLACELVREALARREAAERRRRLAEDYRAGRKDTGALLDDFEPPQLELLDDDEA
jgi:hypothetical protein